MRRLLLLLGAASALLSANATAEPNKHHGHSTAPHHHNQRHHGYDYNGFRLFIYNSNPVYNGPIWLGYDGIYRCTRPYGSVGVLTDDWGRVLTQYNYYGTPRYRLRCR